MADGKMARDWDHTALIVSTMLNINRDPKKSKPVSQSQCHPFLCHKKKKKTIEKVPITALKCFLTGGGK